MNENTNASSGVQDLIERIRGQGVQAAQAEADRILREAKARAAEIVSTAKSEADKERARARSEIDAHRRASADALQLAARDTVLDLKSRVIARFEDFVKRLVVSSTHDLELVRAIVLVIAGHAADEFIGDKEVQVRISRALLEGEPTMQEQSNLAILQLSSDMLREGIELVPDDEVKGGARVRLVNDNLEIDLTEKTVSQLIAKRLLPRFKSLIEGVQD